MNRSQAERLRALLKSPTSLLTDLSEREEYHHDATPMRAVPSALLLAESEQDIIAAVLFCATENIPITARGAGTGLSGGCLVSPGGLLLSIERLKEMIVLPSKKMAVCQPGVITKELMDAAAEHGLTYPPDPASYEESTLGGNVAENAGGLRCKRFGVTKDYILGLEAVLPDGSRLKTGIFNQNRGFCLGDLLPASEGTLGIITRLALRLIPEPASGSTILIAFDKPEDAASAVSEINRSGIIPTVMEFLDGDAAACSNGYERSEDFDRVAAILLLETTDSAPARQTSQLKQICEQSQCAWFRSETDPSQAEALWKVRRNLSNAVKALTRLRISEDVAVPNSRFPELVAFVAKMNLQTYLRVNAYGHAGDGNLHVNFMADKDNPDNRREIERWVDVLMDKTLKLGGTLTGEHGIGLAKRKYISLEYDRATLQMMRDIKTIIDPDNLFNPDKLLPEQKNLITGASNA